MAEDDSSLLRQLQIDRTVRSDSGKRGRILVTVLLVLCAGGALVYFGARSLGLSDGQYVTIRVVTPTVQGANAGSAGPLLVASGYVVPLRKATVSSKITGRLVEVRVEEGEHVRQGQIIARLDDSNTSAALALANAEAASARANYANAQPIFERAARVLRAGISSQQAFDGAKAQYDQAKLAVSVANQSVEVAQRNQDDTVVRAPFDGIVTNKSANVGEIVSPISAGGGFTRTGICTIVDMTSLEVNVDVSERFINLVRPGQNVVVKLDAYLDWELPAHVVAIVPTADKSKGTVMTRIAFRQLDPRILPEMSANVTFQGISTNSEAFAARIFVPPEAILNQRGQSYVFVVVDSHIQKRAVRLGPRTQMGVEVRSGVNPDNQLAIGDLSTLSDGDSVKVQQEGQS